MSLPPQATALLQCLRGEAGAPPDPELAERHGVTALVSGSREQVIRSLALSSELLRLLDLLERRSIPAVAFKGPALSARLYGDVAMRESWDLDVLIPREDSLRAKAVLVEAGYRTDLPVDAGEERAYLRARHELHFAAPGGAQIEIHQSFLAPYFSVPFDYADLWRRMDLQEFCGREIRALPAEDLLIALCAHGTKHCWTRLGWICDIARLIQVEPIDWRRVRSLAEPIGARRMTMLGVALAHRLLHAPLPDEILSETKAPSIVLLTRRVEEALFAPEPAALSALAEHKFFLQARERVRDRILYCARLAFSPTEEDHASLRLPSLFSPLYYPLHAVRVFRKYGLASLKIRS